VLEERVGLVLRNLSVFNPLTELLVSSHAAKGDWRRVQVLATGSSSVLV